MKKSCKKILEEYDVYKELYSEFAIKMKYLVTELLINKKIKYHQISERVKEKQQLENKIIKKNFKYSKLDEITDIAGLRIITYFEDEIDKISDIIINEFEIDYKNSVDKRKLEIDRFGYQSLHYVVFLNSQRQNLPEYKKFSGLKYEIQIRTILQHSWAEINHDIGYKGDFEIPNIAKRTFYRVAALLEAADLEYVRLKEIIDKYRIFVIKEIKTTSDTTLLDCKSLQTYIDKSPIIDETNRLISDYTKIPTLNLRESDFTESDFQFILDRLRSVGIYTIKDLDERIKSWIDEIFQAFKTEYNFSKDQTQILNVRTGIILYYIDFIKID
jgi:putative GTP pyrophosphokinase